MQTDLEKCQSLITEYKYVWARLRASKRLMRHRADIIALDAERDRIHNELRRIAPEIQKTRQDVDIDILTNEKDLAGHDIPEFKLLKTANSGLDRAQYCKLEGGDILNPQKNKQTYIKEEDLDKTGVELFIPFGEETSWHLYDGWAFYDREPDNLERRRRALSVVEQNPGASFVEICSFETFHRGIKLFGVGFPGQNLDALVTFLTIHRKEISISKEFLDETKIREDFIKMVESEIADIHANADDYDGPENESYLLDRYSCYRIDRAPYIDDELKKELLGMLEIKITEAKEREFKQRVEKEVEGKLSEDDDLEEQSRDSQRPLRESMTKRL